MVFDVHVVLLVSYLVNITELVFIIIIIIIFYLFVYYLWEMIVQNLYSISLFQNNKKTKPFGLFSGWKPTKIATIYQSTMVLTSLYHEMAQILFYQGNKA